MKERRTIADPYRLVGMTLGGKYQLEAVLGIGGMGIVYLALHSAINRRVAVKILKPDLAVNDGAVVESFRREAVVSGGLVHPNIINVTDADVTPDGLAYMVMELLEWPTLEEVLVRNPIPELNRTDRILSQICAALAHAHALKIVHRDLKPANIALVNEGTPEEQVKVLDFGIAKSLSDNAGQVSQAIGTPLYASPEQFTHGAQIDERADIYSLGVITYQLLTGKLPFRGKTVGEIITLHLTQPPPSPRTYQPSIPEPLEGFILSVLSKNAVDRPRSATEFLARFREAARSYGLATGPLVLGAETVGQLNSPTLGLTLTGQPVTLRISGAPPNAEVKINDWSRGRTDDTGGLVVGNLAPGNHIVEVRKSGFQSWKMTLTCASGETRDLVAKCAPLPQVGGDSQFLNTGTASPAPVAWTPASGNWNSPAPMLSSTQPGVSQPRPVTRPLAYPPPPETHRSDQSRQFLIIGAILGVLLIGGGGIFLARSRSQKTASDPLVSTTTPPPPAKSGAALADYLDRFEQISSKVRRTVEPIAPSNSSSGSEVDRAGSELRELAFLTPVMIEDRRQQLTQAESEVSQAAKALGDLSPPESVQSVHAQLLGRYRELQESIHAYEVSLRDLQNLVGSLNNRDRDEPRNINEHTGETERTALKRDRDRLRATWEDVKRTEDRLRKEAK
jgi:serine/threonine-protein kinase